MILVGSLCRQFLRRVVYELLALNLIVILMDIALLITEYRDHPFD